MSPIPVVLVTGFLGSGKTTLLRQLAESYPDWHMVFLVNEFASTDVDGETLAATGRLTHSVIGGSLFCECKAGDFIRTLRETVLAHHREQPIALLVIETSGTANPDAIGQLLQQHGLAQDFSLRRIATVVAPAKFLRLLGNLPVVESQIRASDFILINKIDTVEVATIEEVEKAIRRCNPTAEILRTEYCRGLFSLPERLASLPQGQITTSKANPFSTTQAVWPAHRSIAEARDFLTGVPESILRIKGRLQTPEGCWQVERTLDTLEIKRMADSPLKESSLVFIAHDDNESDLLEVSRQLSSLLNIPSPP